jgi:hypothetical protein
MPDLPSGVGLVHLSIIGDTIATMTFPIAFVRVARLHLLTRTSNVSVNLNMFLMFSWLCRSGWSKA